MTTPTVERAPSKAEDTPTRHALNGHLLAPTARRAPAPKPFRTWYWTLVPALAIAAYATVLRIGFLADDLVLLTEARTGPTLETLLPRPDWFLYRPLGHLLIWDLGWQLWDFNPLPFHLQGLLLHAGVALTLGLLVAELTARRGLGLLAGALFAIYPLNTEAVGWVAAQWDALAALFGLLSLWLFTRWWLCRGIDSGNPGRRFYLLSLLLFAIAIYTKESIFAFLPLFALSAWVTTPRLDRRTWGSLLYALLPFALVLASNLALRFLTWGSIGGYQTAPTNYLDFLWSRLATYVGILLAPVSAVLLGNATVQVVGAVTSVLLLLGLIWHAREQRRLLTLAVAWMLLVFIPVMNLPVNSADFSNNRLLYLASAGYCVMLAALLYQSIISAHRWRTPALSLVGVLLLLGIVISWVHLRPWHTATVQVADLDEELRRMIPVEPRPNGMVWYADNVPIGYQGAQLFGLGLGLIRTLSGGDWPGTEMVQRAEAVDLATDHRDAFALRFFYSQSANRFHISYASGITWDSEPPSPQERGVAFQMWDFTRCAPDIVGSWQIVQARPVCEPDKGLILRDTEGDQQMLGPSIWLDPHPSRARFVRLRVAVRYPSNVDGPKLLGEWFWKVQGQEWSAERAVRMPIKQNGHSHIYWTFLPTSDIEAPITRLRFDPANGTIASAIRWIAVDLVK